MAKFSAAHYVILEKAFVKARHKLMREEEGEGLLGLSIAADEVAEALAQDNERFDKGQFNDVVKGLRPVPKRIR